MRLHNKGNIHLILFVLLSIFISNCSSTPKTQPELDLEAIKDEIKTEENYTDLESFSEKLFLDDSLPEVKLDGDNIIEETDRIERVEAESQLAEQQIQEAISEFEDNQNALVYEDNSLEESFDNELSLEDAQQDVTVNDNELSSEPALSEAESVLETAEQAQTYPNDEQTSLYSNEISVLEDEKALVNNQQTEAEVATVAIISEPAPTALEPKIETAHVSKKAKKVWPHKRTTIKSTPFYSGDFVMNGYYFARPSEKSWDSVSQHIYGRPDRAQLLASWNPGTLKPGALVYYNSPKRPEDTEKLLMISQDLQIPLNFYTVKKGDSLSKIALKLYNCVSCWPEIAQLNQSIQNVNVVQIGQELKTLPLAYSTDNSLAELKQDFNDQNETLQINQIDVDTHDENIHIQKEEEIIESDAEEFAQIEVLNEDLNSNIIPESEQTLAESNELESPEIQEPAEEIITQIPVPKRQNDQLSSKKPRNIAEITGLKDSNIPYFLIISILLFALSLAWYLKKRKS